MTKYNYQLRNPNLKFNTLLTGGVNSGTQKSSSVNPREQSIFKKATREDLAKVDYNKVLNENQGNNAELSPLENMLKEFFSIGKVKTSADKNGDGVISEEEAQAYINELSKKDGDGETLSLADFEKLINEQGIDLESITKFLSALTGFDTGMQNVQMQPQSSMAPARTGGYAAGGGGYSSAAAVPKTIHNMTLNELHTEKSNRESTLADKQEALKAVQSGETQGIKAAQEDVKNAKEAYEQALKNDPSSSKYAGIISANNQKIEENQTALDKNSADITSKQSEISQQQSAISSSETMLSSLESALANLPAPTGKPEDSKRDEQINTKKNQLTKEIETKKKEIETQKAQLAKLNEGLENLQNTKTQLEGQKTELQERKAKYDETINKNCSDAIKEKLAQYNAATKNLEDVKAKELSAANSAYQSAQKQVNEINTVISQKEADAAASKYTVSSDIVEKALELAESQIGVRENGGSNDSAEIRKYKNGAANGNPWCASFTSWLYGAGQGSSNDKTFGYTASSQEIKRQANSAGCYASKNSNYVPQKGDLAMWSKSASTGHVGIVSEVYSDGSFDVIEGNSGNSVKKRHYSSKHSVGGGFDGFVQMDKWLQA